MKLANKTLKIPTISFQFYFYISNKHSEDMNPHTGVLSNSPFVVGGGSSLLVQHPNQPRLQLLRVTLHLMEALLGRC